MKIDATITISVILAIVAIFANVISTILNNRHQTKMKQLEIYELQKRDALQNFINVSVECFKNGNDWRENKEFVKALYSLQLYFKSADSNLIDSLNNVMNEKPDENKFKISFCVVISKLAKEIQKH